MSHLVEDDDEQYFNGVCNKIAVPKEIRSESRHNPQDWDNCQRQGKRDEQRHVMMAVELIDNHDRVDIAERNEAQGKHAQSDITLFQDLRCRGTEQPGNELRINPSEYTGNQHGHSDELEGFAQHQAETLVVALTHLNSTQRLNGTTAASQEEVVDLQQVHTNGKGEDTRTTHRVEHDTVGTEQEQRQTYRSDGQRCTFRDDIPKRLDDLFAP